MYDYPIRFEQDVSAPGVAVFCRDLPELNSYGDDRKHAIREALDGIESTLSIYVDERRSIPPASAPLEGEHVVHLPAVTVAKIALWNTMMERDMRKADLCRLLGVHQAQGDRLVDFLHTSKMDQVERALDALELYVDVKVMSQNPTRLLIRQIQEPTATRYLVHLANKGLDELSLPIGLAQEYAAVPPKLATVVLDGDDDKFWWLSESSERLSNFGWDAFSLARLKHEDLGPTHDEDLKQQKTQRG
ncbi:HicB_like antitoxin of toxin-antitoxin system [Pseudomonas sp. NFACC48-1]|nr:HicB_like antitoxin of toxin-antitoxin system [Pseudomonas sp. NFACC44-2]SDA86459.1 HicB_like antitoxin of toxin-antitoxin system [Pseudomonas sp. NFACC51]SFI53908.1 HicB_like antitoxin of toxin-antitoxin system [Pseudomonas sp. NFACC54]SFT29614.1 HicB_like antitoxin of toxin-antitoxin system [Pseudomonas sp. NFACC48-1]